MVTKNKSTGRSRGRNHGRRANVSKGTNDAPSDATSQAHSSRCTPVPKQGMDSNLLDTGLEEQMPKITVKISNPDMKRQPLINLGRMGYSSGIAEKMAKTTRAGREVKTPKHYDSDITLERSASQKSDVEMDDEPSVTEHVKTVDTLPDLLTLQEQTSDKTACTDHQPSHEVPEPTIMIADELSSSDTMQPASPTAEELDSVRCLDVDPSLHEVLLSFKQSDKIQIDLPALSWAWELEKEKPYSSTDLMHLYIISYQDAQWNLCDVIADTWIRAFHDKRKKTWKDDRFQIWRPNSSLEQRMRERRPFDGSAPDYQLDTRDPSLHPDVTQFDPKLLAELYDHTPSNCGARLLWADSMALAGDKMVGFLNQKKKQGTVLHQDLIHDITCTSLRMVRRKLTLKIEEGTEGAWCKRYHEHTKHGLACYRQLAWERKQGGEDNSEEESDEDYEIEKGKPGVGVKPACRVIEDDDVEMPDAKRVHFSLGSRDIIEIDAEGETDDD